MEKERFSLLLLEPGEYYFEDYSCYLLENSKNENRHSAGRLKICSKSLVFVPNNITDALLKISLKDCTKITKMGNSTIEGKEELMSVTCKQYAEMLAGNRLSPYRFTNNIRQFEFSFNYAQVDDLLGHINQLHRASGLPIAEYNQMIAAIAYGRQSRIKFDPMWLENLDEKIVLESFGSKITPLVVNPGRIVVSTNNLYFQPMNNIEQNRYMKLAFSHIKTIEKRRFLLQHVGLEIYCDENTNCANHVYLSLKSRELRDNLYDVILQQPSVKLLDNDQEIMTLQWQNGTISNYDYLLYINSLADRTFNDLTQYPVFPWVISDYTSNVLDLDNEFSYRDLSKPVGALNPERLHKLKERYKEMSDPKFLYGSHYSTPGFVLFYLVRKYPHYMLCLQNGRFDHPDRMFNSIPHVWKNVMRNMSDFKELLPEFYDINAKGDFLANVHGINFGFRHDGTKVGDVALPPWAESPEDFINKLRRALESDYVSLNLHNWIDLIFGYKQTGVNAELSDNKFYYLCYEGAVDLDAIQDWNQRHALEVQIMEFGQIPKQIFKNPHASRFNNFAVMMKSGFALGTLSRRMYSFCACDRYVSYETHKDEITGLAMSSNGQIVFSISKDTHMKMNDIHSSLQQRSVKLSNMPLSSILLLPDEATVIVGSCDSTAIVYDVECARTIDVIRGHDDAISCMVWCQQSCYLITASWDCTVTVWQASIPWKPFRLTTGILAQLQHDAKLTCIVVSRNEKLMASGTETGGLFIWSLESFRVTHRLPGHTSDITGISFSSGAERVISCSTDDTFKVYDLATGMQVYTRSLHQPLTCLLWDDFNVLIGTYDGTLVVWDLIDNSMLKEIKCHSGKLNAMVSSSDGSILVTAGQDHIVNIWKLQ